MTAPQPGRRTVRAWRHRIRTASPRPVPAHPDGAARPDGDASVRSTGRPDEDASAGHAPARAPGTDRGTPAPDEDAPAHAPARETGPDGEEAARHAAGGVARSVAAWCTALAYPLLLHTAVLHESEPTGMRLVLPALLAVLPVALLRRRPLVTLVLVLAGGFAATVTAASVLAAGPGPVGPPPGTAQRGWEGNAWQVAALQAVVTDAALAYMAATRRTRTVVAGACAALTVQVAAASYHRSGSDRFVSAVLLIVLAVAIAWMTGLMIRERREHARTLGEQAARQAVTEERLRIARELHDMVAHSIGVIAIQAGVGRRVVDSRPAAARDALAAIETTSRDTLAGLRRMLGGLRRADPQERPRDPAPGLGDLDRLLGTFRDAGLDVGVRWRGERRALPPDVELSAYRIVQEAITNVARHAGTARCTLVVDYGTDRLAVEVTDDGCGSPEGRGPRVGKGPHGSTDRLDGTDGAPHAGGGYGITGMRERAALLDGRLTAGPRPEGGFRVAAWLPLPEGTR
ncbi:sensor histidine kinase [Streptomyces sp. t39]|uniref:sensor histidine kinase n=1 Tax=Streptomyces sp. t39 TaxID=1828156 RepID=UPI0011CE8FDE|nr:sensor histidine kinase [Streptomyces sp. t39]TXS48127.1 sensor histidine kinase [Streptomyces sp. t39]